MGRLSTPNHAVIFILLLYSISCILCYSKPPVDFNSYNYALPLIHIAV